MHRYFDMLMGESESDELCDVIWLYQQFERHAIHDDGDNVISNL